jgi:hypothetical protein
LTLGFDYGAGQIQGLVTAFRDPAAWATANLTALKSFASPEGFAAYVRNNTQPIRELAQYGSGIGSVPEQVAGLGKGGALTALPKVVGRKVGEVGAPRLGKAIESTAAVPEAFGRLFQTFLDVAKVERWKARRETTPREEWPRAIQEIEHELNMGRMESIGVGPSQALAERIFLLAPSYYRGALGLIGDMSAKGTTGAQARRAMGSYLAGTTAIFTAGALAAGLSWDEIRKRLNPAQGNFLMVPVKIGGKTIELGFGGIMRSLMRLGGNVIKTSAENPENWKSLSSENNPFIKWLRGHSAPIPSKVWDQFSGKDYLGEDTDMSSLSKGFLPLWAQNWFSRDKKQPGATTAAITAASFLGLNAYPQSVANRLMVDRDRLAKKGFGKPYEALPMRDQARVSQQIARMPEYAVKPPSTAKQIERAFRNQVRRQNMVQSALDESVQAALEEKGLHVPGFEPRIKIGPVDVILTEKQQRRYGQLLIEEYNRLLTNRVATIRKMQPQDAQEKLNTFLLDAKERARLRLQKEFNQ